MAKGKQTLYTQQGYQELVDELYRRTHEERERIKELEELIENAVIMDESEIDSSVVSLGSTVKVLNVTLNQEFTYYLVGSNEANPAEGKISDQSPIGSALIGKKAGKEDITIEVPNGTLVMKLLEVSRTQA